MKIHFCGAAGTTTGSQHLLEVNGKRILLDCGMYQGRRKDAARINREFPYFNPEIIDYCILSHAHIDHSGNLPMLVKSGFKGFIYCTPATRSLCQLMLADAARIQGHDARFLNKMNKRKGLKVPDILPNYSEQDAEKCMHHINTLNYDMPMELFPGVTLSFHDAGHILGAAQVVLDIEDQEDGKKKRLLFSGDIGRGENELLQPPAAVENVDIMLMESTYGGRNHEAAARDDESFCAAITRAMARGGNVYIPAFAVERTQQLLYILNRAYRNGSMKPYPVYVDSPMAVGATEIFRIHPECFNKEVYDFLFEESNPFDFEQVHMVRSVTQSQQINDITEQAIIISASGMCEAGRILHHLKHGISNPDNTILFVGYCAMHTLGRRIMDGAERIPILGEEYIVRAQVECLDSFSGHADHSELVHYFRSTGGTKSRVILVHGEKEACASLKDALLAEKHGGHVHIAELGRSITC